ncbi:MAG: hypothetical protein EA385_12080 [Salinarimonadaceae bacterium]|nr:MAG: hypothetical protein EA385_12080 [Salinarimonadaceae bacterium]
MQRIIAPAPLAASLAGCASAASDIRPAPASPLAYRDLDCAVLEAEAWRTAPATSPPCRIAGRPATPS